MRIKDSRNHKVFKADVKANITILSVGDSKKNADNTWTNFFWSVVCVGEAHKVAQNLGKHDVITIKEGIAYLETFKDKTYGKVTAFAIEVTEEGSFGFEPTPPAEDSFQSEPGESGYVSPGNQPF